MVNKRSLGISVALGLAIVVVAFAALRQLPKPVSNSTANTNDAATIKRAEYAALYQASWRQDQGLGSTIMTATLFTPPMTADLLADTGRSESESQMLQAIQKAKNSDLVFYLTIDSVAAPISDDVIESGLSLSDAEGTAYTFTSWTPLIGQSNLINVSTGSSQTGVAIFASPDTVDWTTLHDLKLTASHIGDQPTRQFIWATPSLLLDTK